MGPGCGIIMPLFESIGSIESANRTRKEARMRGLKRVLAVFMMAAMVMATIPGCGDDGDGGTGTQATPPELPPLWTFKVDFSDFVQGGQYGPIKGADPFDPLSSKHNWLWASTNVFVWHTMISVALLVPVLSFVEALGHEPVRQPDGTWVWDYNVGAGQTMLLVELHGRVEGEEVTWEVYLSLEDQYEDFMWYSGQCDLEGTEGTWTLKQSPEEPEDMLLIEWERDPDTETGNVKYSNVIPGDPENGAYVYYEISEGGTYDAYLDVYHKQDEWHTYIEWHRTNKVGRIKDSDHFGDDLWHCWDGNFDDVACTP
jgi:hypothetical protein